MGGKTDNALAPVFYFFRKKFKYKKNFINEKIGRIVSLNAENNQIKSLNNQLQKELRFSISNNLELVKNLKDDKTYSELMKQCNQNQELVSRLNSLISKNHDLSHDIQSCTLQINSLISKNNSLSDELVSKKTECEHLKDERVDLNNHIEELKVEHEKYRKEVSHLEKLAQRHNNDHSSLKKSFVILNNRHKKQILDLTEDLKKANDRSSLLSNKFKKYRNYFVEQQKINKIKSLAAGICLINSGFASPKEREIATLHQIIEQMALRYEKIIHLHRDLDTSQFHAEKLFRHIKSIQELWESKNDVKFKIRRTLRFCSFYEDGTPIHSLSIPEWTLKAIKRRTEEYERTQKERQRNTVSTYERQWQYDKYTMASEEFFSSYI
jgi:chromosome segregation ATPase